jgi:hypothetical protein
MTEALTGCMCLKHRAARGLFWFDSHRVRIQTPSPLRHCFGKRSTRLEVLEATHRRVWKASSKARKLASECSALIPAANVAAK